MDQPTAAPRTAVLGAGSWGTALAALASARTPTMLWARDAGQARQLGASHENARYLPGIKLPDQLTVSADLPAVLDWLGESAGVPLVILGVPVAGLDATCRLLAGQLAAHGVAAAHLLWTCKGFEQESGRLPHEVARAALAASPGVHTGVLSGPSFAKEVARGLPVALTVASASADLREAVTMALHGGAVRVYASTDIAGVEVGGALKNVIALACGISDGLALGTNARAALITRGLAEMTRFGLALGAVADTFAGLTGLGDLVLTATGELSRNRQVGIQIGSGHALSEILKTGVTAEGVRCARPALERARRLGVNLPITAAVCAVLFEGVAPMTAVSSLLAREARYETRPPPASPSD